VFVDIHITKWDEQYKDIYSLMWVLFDLWSFSSCVLWC